MINAIKTWENGDGETRNFSDYGEMCSWLSTSPEAGIAAYNSEGALDQVRLQSTVARRIEDEQNKGIVVDLSFIHHWFSGIYPSSFSGNNTSTAAQGQEPPPGAVVIGERRNCNNRHLFWIESVSDAPESFWQAWREECEPEKILDPNDVPYWDGDVRDGVIRRMRRSIKGVNNVQN